jgi:hypothetical protein
VLVYNLHTSYSPNSPLLYHVTERALDGKVRLEQIGALHLPYKGHFRIGFSPNGDVLLQDKDARLHLYKHNGDRYIEVWDKPAPNVSEFFKAIHSTGQILLQGDYNEPTLLFTRSLRKEQTYQREGFLLGYTDDGLDLYGRGTKSEDARDWQIDVWDEEKRVITLSHPSAPGQPESEREGWGWFLSACTAGDRIVVVETYTQSLYVFTKQGNLLQISEPFLSLIYITPG